MPGQRGSGETRRAYHASSGLKRITETIENTHKVTSVLGGEGVSSGTRMTCRSESRKEAAMPTLLLTSKAPTLFGIWNVRTMYEAGKCAQIAAEMTAYNLGDKMDRVWLHTAVNQTDRPLLRS